MLISIITVTYNCKADIKKTLDSVAMQDFEDYEMLIIDGNSDDGTLQVIDQYVNSIHNLKISSEPDNGIYDAMNKGIKKAVGKYLYFLNAGDYFTESNVLTKVASKFITDKDIYYGTVLWGGSIQYYPEKLNCFWLVYREQMICHQALFAKRELYNDFPYDTSFKICADREWLIRVLKADAAYESIQDITICFYDGNGVSSVYSKFDKESIRLARLYGGTPAVAFVKIKRAMGKIIRRLIKKQ